MHFQSRSFLSHTSFRISFLTFHHRRASKISRDSLFRLWSSILLQATGGTYLYDIEKKFGTVSMHSLLLYNLLLSDKKTKYWKYAVIMIDQSNQSSLKYAISSEINKWRFINIFIIYIQNIPIKVDRNKMFPQCMEIIQSTSEFYHFFYF